MNRRSLIALGVATALARFFPMPALAQARREPWLNLLEECGFAPMEPARGLEDVVTWGGQREIGRVVSSERLSDALRITIAFDDGRTLVTDVVRWP